MWDAKHKENVNKIIRELLTYSSSSSVKHSPRTEILLTELIALSNQNLEYWLAIKTLTALKKSNRKSIVSFNEIYLKELAEFKKLKNKKWTIILPYNNLLLKRKFKILNEDFRIIKQSSFKRLINYDKVLEAINKNYKYRFEKFELPDLFILLQTNGHNLYSCWNNVKTKFTILQGVYDYGLSKGTWIQKDGPLTIFSHPEWILSQDSDGNIAFNNFLIYGKPRPLPMGSLNVGRAIDLLDKIRQDASPNTTKALIYDCFRLYAQAMESAHIYNCFLGLWQILENVCVSENIGGKTAEITKRLDLIVKETKVLDFSIEGIYKSLSNKRNNIVHKGIDATDNKDVNILKLLTESAIEWLIKKEKSLKTKAHINEYFNLLTKYSRDKKILFETMEYMNRAKK